MQDGEKGLRITKFPPVLPILLSRFNTDYETQISVKLNDKVTFPDILDLNSFIHDSSSDPSTSKISQAQNKNSSGNIAAKRLFSFCCRKFLILDRLHRVQ